MLRRGQALTQLSRTALLVSGLICHGVGAAAADEAKGAIACTPSGRIPVAVLQAEAPGEYRDATGALYHISDILFPPDAAAVPGRGNVAGQMAGLNAYPVGPADRWGTIPAVIVRTDGAAAGLVQAQLLEEGLALFQPQASSGACAEKLRRSEARARRSGSGLWGSGRRVPVYSAANPAGLLEAAGSYAIVRGRVVSLGKTRSTRYLNFGGHWKTDFTVTLAAGNADTVLAGVTRDGWSFEDLDGRAVEIRGVVEIWDGPVISWRHPEQLVVLEEKRAGRDGQNQE